MPKLVPKMGTGGVIENRKTSVCRFRLELSSSCSSCPNFISSGIVSSGGSLFGEEGRSKWADMQINIIRVDLYVSRDGHCTDGLALLAISSS